MGLAATQTLTNKILSGNTATNLISGSGIFTFNTSGTITAPNTTDTLVTLALSQTLTNKVINASNNTITNIVNANIGSAAAIAVNKLAALTPSTVVQTDGSGFLQSSSVSNTTLSYLDATSSIQTQLNSKQQTVSFAAVGSTPNSNGGGISAGVITLQPANGSFPGLLTTAAQTIAGAKNFTSALQVPAGSDAAPGIGIGSTVTGFTNFGPDTYLGLSVNGTRQWQFQGANLVASNSGSISGTTNITASGNITGGALRISNNSVIFTQNAGSVSAYSIKWPNTQGAVNSVPQNDGSGNLSWVSVPGVPVAPTVTVLTSGTSQTYTTPANTLYLKVRMVGGGAGGSGGYAGGQGTAGGDTSFGLATAHGGPAGSQQYNPVTTGAVASLGGYTGIGITGGTPQGAPVQTNSTGSVYGGGGIGANSPFGGAGAGASPGTAGGSAATNSGSGGGGGSAQQSSSSNYLGGAGGAAGAYCEFIIPSPSATYTYTVGTGGSGGASPGGGGGAGGNGGSGLIYVEACFQ